MGDTEHATAGPKAPGAAVRTGANAFPWRLAAGYSCLSAWTQVLFSDRFAGAAESAGTSILTVHAIGSALAVLAALAVMLLAARIAPLYTKRAALGAWGIAAAAATGGLALAEAGAVDPHALVPLNGLAAVASTWLVLVWFEQVVRHGAVAALGAFGFAAVAGSALYFAALALPALAADVLLCLLPVLAAMLLRPQRTEPVGKKVPAPPVGVSRSVPSWHALIPLVCVAGLANYANGTYLNLALADPSAPFGGIASLAYTSASHALTVLAAVALAALLARRHMRVAFCISICCVLAASLLTFSWDAAPIQPLLLLVHVGVELMGLLTVVALVDAAAAEIERATLLFALYRFTQFCGTLAGQLSSIAFADNRPLTALLLMTVLVAMLLLAFMARDGGAAAPTPSPSLAPDDAPLDRLADAHGLSPRELEVARLWVAGHNSAFIEETLGISKYTVRTHLKNIYTKTGTANKEELIRLAESIAVQRP